MSVSTTPRHYELLLILDPNLDERTVSPSIDTFLNVVRQGGGSVENVDIWGKRRLAFEIARGDVGWLVPQRRLGRFRGMADDHQKESRNSEFFHIHRCGLPSNGSLPATQGPGRVNR